MICASNVIPFDVLNQSGNCVITIKIWYNLTRDLEKISKRVVVSLSGSGSGRSAFWHPHDATLFGGLAVAVIQLPGSSGVTAVVVA